VFLGKHLLVLCPLPVNGTTDAYGTVTQLLDNGLVNLTIFRAGGVMEAGWDMTVHPDRAAAQAALDAQTGVLVPVAYLPPAP
jgi:hypothetical protein